MSAMEKVAWTELTVALAAALLVACLVPWLGNAATAGFGLLGAIGLCVVFVRQRNAEVVYDERDREIDLRAMRWGIGAAWQLTFMTLIVIVMWSSMANDGVVPTVWLSWLIGVQCVVGYAVKGLVGVVSYRRLARAA